MKKKTQKARKRVNRHSTQWPLLLALGGVALILLALAALKATSSPKVPIEVSGAPRLKVDKEKVDLGNVRLGQWVKVSFELSNVGDQPLRFSEKPYIEVAAGC